MKDSTTGQISLSDFLCAEIFDVAPVLDADGKKRAAVPDSDSDGGAAPPLVWRENAFPYAVRRGIEHHCVWSTSAAALRDEARFREVLERHRPSDTFATCHFINPPALHAFRRWRHFVGRHLWRRADLSSSTATMGGVIQVFGPVART